MVRFIAQQLRLLAILFFTIVLSAFAQGDPKIIGHIYDGDKIVANVIHIDEDPIGSGGAGFVLRVTVIHSHGEPETFAMKLFQSDLPPETKQEILRRMSRLPAVYKQDSEGVLAYSKVLKLVLEDAKDRPFDIVLSNLASGSALDLMNILELETGESGLEDKLGIIAKLKNKGLKAIELLAANGLTHGDVKLSNILVSTTKTIDWTHPKASKIKFKLADFDSLIPINQTLVLKDPVLGPPEIWLKLSKKATPAYDLYTHAMSIYVATFNSLPYFDYFSSPEGAQLYKEVWADLPSQRLFESKGLDLIKTHLYGDPIQYQHYLQWIDKKFRSLENPEMSPIAKSKLKEIRKFVLKGLKLSPDERLRAFPSIQKKAARADCSQVILKYLRATLSMN